MGGTALRNARGIVRSSPSQGYRVHVLKRGVAGVVGGQHVCPGFDQHPSRGGGAAEVQRCKAFDVGSVDVRPGLMVARELVGRSVG